MLLHRLCMKRRHYLDHRSLLAPLNRDKASPSRGMQTFNPAPHVFPVCPEWVETQTGCLRVKVGRVSRAQSFCERNFRHINFDSEC